MKTCESILEKYGNSKIEYFMNISYEHVDFYNYNHVTVKSSQS